MKNKTDYHMNIGGASIILLIIVFALTIFAALSVRASYHEMKLAVKTRESVENYYELDKEATIKMAQIRDIYTRMCYSASQTDESHIFDGLDLIREGDMVKYSVEKNGTKLNVTLQLSLDNPHVTVKEWRLQESEHGDYGQGGDIWDGFIEIVE